MSENIIFRNKVIAIAGKVISIPLDQWTYYEEPYFVGYQSKYKDHYIKINNSSLTINDQLIKLEALDQNTIKTFYLSLESYRNSMKSKDYETLINKLAKDFE